MLEWTPTLAAAYRAQLGHAERGEPFEQYDGLLGNTYTLAARYVTKWRQAVSR